MMGFAAIALWGCGDEVEDVCLLRSKCPFPNDMTFMACIRELLQHPDRVDSMRWTAEALGCK